VGMLVGGSGRSDLGFGSRALGGVDENYGDCVNHFDVFVRARMM